MDNGKEKIKMKLMEEIKEETIIIKLCFSMSN